MKCLPVLVLSRLPFGIHELQVLSARVIGRSLGLLMLALVSIAVRLVARFRLSEFYASSCNEEQSSPTLHRRWCRREV